jgi:hypothetical protein
LVMAKQRKKFETTPVKNLYNPRTKTWERSWYGYRIIN